MSYTSFIFLRAHPCYTSEPLLSSYKLTMPHYYSYKHNVPFQQYQDSRDEHSICNTTKDHTADLQLIVKTSVFQPQFTPFLKTKIKATNDWELQWPGFDSNTIPTSSAHLKQQCHRSTHTGRYGGTCNHPEWQSNSGQRRTRDVRCSTFAGLISIEDSGTLTLHQGISSEKPCILECRTKHSGSWLEIPCLRQHGRPAESRQQSYTSCMSFVRWVQIKRILSAVENLH